VNGRPQLLSLFIEDLLDAGPPPATVSPTPPDPAPSAAPDAVRQAR
jgi:hypothetical protein